LTVRSTSTRRISVVVLLLVAVSLATAAQVGKVPRIGVLLPGSPTPEYERRLDAFRQGLRELGYSDTQNILLEYRWAHAQYEHLDALVAELLRLQVDVLVTDSNRAGLAAKRATSTLPIVLALASDPVGTGLVESLARPGGNITGMTLISPELSAKRLELLKDMVPTAARIAVLMNPDNPHAQLHWRDLAVAAPKLHVQLQAVEVRRATDLEPAFATVVGWRADALLVIEDPTLLPAHQTEIVDFATRHRLPTMTGYRSLVDAGGLMSYGASFPDMFRRAATFVVKILRGAKPADLPVEQPTKFELVINLKTAKALGITMPPSLLLLADEVIQ
jgi:putative tryptophan/tyrosine transport system substrate-binding protein